MEASDYSDVFVSYRRKDVEFTKQLVEALRGAGKEVWIDWEDIPPGSEGFSDDIRRGLEGADAFIAILSPDYLESTYCVDLELGNAIKMNKKLIPIVLKKFDDYPIPQGIGHINWIYFTPHAGQENTFEDGFQKVLDTLDIDLEYNREHKRYLLRALEWDNGNRSNSFLLTGDEILTAEAWLLEGANKEPAPTDLHTEYIQSSRKLAKRRQRMLFTGITTALVISVILTILSLIGFREASINAEIARANEAEAEAQEALAVAAREDAERNAEVSNSLALASAALQPDNKDISVAMALEATQIENPPGGAITALMRSAFAPGARDVVQVSTTSTYPTFEPAISSDLSRVVMGNQMFDITTGEPLLTFESAPDVPVIAAFLPSDEEVIIAGDISFDTQSQQESGDTDDVNLVTLGIYSTDDGSLIRELSQDAVSSLTLNADSTRIAVGHPARDEYVIYDIATGEEVTQITSTESGVTMFDDFTRYAYITSDESEQSLLHIADVDTQATLSEITLDSSLEPYQYYFAVNPTGRTIAVNDGQSLTAYDVMSGEIVTVFDNYDASFSNWSVAIDYTPSGKHLILGVTTDSRVNIWDTTTGNLVDSFQGHDEPLVTVGAIDNQFIFSLDASDRVVVWDVKDHFLAGSFVSTTDYINPETDEFLVQTANRTITRIALDTFLPVGESFQIPQDISIGGYSPEMELFVGATGETVENTWGFETINADTLVLISAETGEIVAEHEFVMSPDDLDNKYIYNNTGNEMIELADVDGLTIDIVNVSDLEGFLSDSKILLNMSVELSNTSEEFSASTRQRMVWDRQANTFTPSSIGVDPRFGSPVAVRQNGVFVFGTPSNADFGDESNVLVQVDPQTLQEVNRINLHDDVSALTLNEDGTQFMTISGTTANKLTHLNIHDVTSGDVLDTQPLSIECCFPSLNYDSASGRLGYFDYSGGGGGGPISPSLGFSVGGESYTSLLVNVESGSVMWDFEQPLTFVGFTSDFSRMILADTSDRYYVYRNDSLDSLIAWTCENRYIAELGDELRQAYGITQSSNTCDTTNVSS